MNVRRGTRRVLCLELVSRGVCPRTGNVPDTLPREDIPGLLARVQANRAGLSAVLLDRRDQYLDAARSEAEGSKA